MPLRRDGADLLLAIRLTPKAARARLGGTFTDAAGQRWLHASVTAPPDKGKANAALLTLLARHLRVPGSSILLETGDTNRLKRLRIAGADPHTEQSLREIAEKERSAT
ncbi:uncharacterized protein YggU (UPF0235/DUF167 family) [Sphingobium sp. B11D3B]|uniref:DUF167 domain-containing protein n=1 Tax=Sphingobium sp. B11D3B TaxID=2940575 RepID=UPI0022260915|nr:DUF167 family protein [Sphingobium sp. B11D3B]MCW2389122.1 uncharacterized protein YggU (UPF0235/DUF167 family) [Sphingobium sp. B11D3B]